jgi:hypothetical protein
VSQQKFISVMMVICSKYAYFLQAKETMWPLPSKVYICRPRFNLLFETIGAKKKIEERKKERENNLEGGWVDG